MNQKNSMDETQAVTNLNIDNLITAYSGKVYNIAYRILGNEHDAEDVTQETFISVYNNLSSFQNRSSIYTWIYRIALNHCFRMKRTPNKLIQASFDETIHRDNQPLPEYLEQNVPPTEKKVLTDELIFEVREKCHYFVTFRLTEEQRIVFILRELFRFSYADIAYILDLPETTVKSRLKRARDNLTNHFKRNCYWYDNRNKCRCENKLGYIISKYPQILKDVNRKADKPEYRKMVAEAVKRKEALAPGEIINRIPMIDYLLKPAENFIK